MPTHLPQNQFITNSVTPPPPAVTDTAGVSPCPPDAPAGTITSDDWLPRTWRCVNAEPPPEPTSSTGGPQEAPAGSAPNTAAPAGALAAPWEDGFWFVLLEVLDIPPIDLHETPLFVREADGFLRRNA